MANCHNEFQKFYEEIKLGASKMDFLRSARNAIRDEIKKHFRETIKVEAPSFHGQGSYAMSTIVNPLGGEYDIDDGVYLNNLDPDRSKWPTAETVHSWIYGAVKDHTKEDPIDMRACIRVVYSGRYHVDLPIYGMYNNKPYLAEKGKSDWPLSDPKALTDWFKAEVQSKGEQPRRIVRYLKAWADNKSKLGKLPSGLVLTVLAVNNYVNSDRDDRAFTKTVEKIHNQILVSSVIANPVNPHESLSDNLSESQVENLRERLSTLLDNAKAALETDSKEEACKSWEKEFGDRFPLCEAKKSSVTYPLLASSRPKPWSAE